MITLSAHLLPVTSGLFLSLVAVETTPVKAFHVGTP